MQALLRLRKRRQYLHYTLVFYKCQYVVLKNFENHNILCLIYAAQCDKICKRRQ